MPGTLDLNNYLEDKSRRRLGQSSVTAPSLRERVLAAQNKQEAEKRSRTMSAKLEGPVTRAVTRAVKQTDFRGALDRRLEAQTKEFAAANPASLTGRLMATRLAETPETRASKLAAPGQFGAQRGSRLRTSSVQRTLRRRTGT